MQKNKFVGGNLQIFESAGNIQRIQSRESSDISQIIDEEPHTFTTISNSNFDHIDINNNNSKLTESPSLNQDNDKMQFENTYALMNNAQMQVCTEFQDNINKIIKNRQISSIYDIYTVLNDLFGMLVDTELEKTINLKNKTKEREFLLGYLLSTKNQFNIIQNQDIEYSEPQISTPVYVTQSYKVLFQKINNLLEKQEQKDLKNKLIRYLYILYLSENNWSIKYDILDFINWCFNHTSKSIQETLSISLSNRLIENISRKQFKFYQTITNEEQLRIMLAFSRQIKHANINIASDSITFSPDIIKAIFDGMEERTTYFYVACHNSIVCNFFAYSEVIQEKEEQVQDEILEKSNGNAVSLENQVQNVENHLQQVDQSTIQTSNKTLKTTITNYDDEGLQTSDKKENLSHKKIIKHTDNFAKVDFVIQDINLLIQEEEKAINEGIKKVYKLIMQQSSYYINNVQWTQLHLKCLIAYDCKPFEIAFPEEIESLSLIRSECINFKKCCNLKHLLLHGIPFDVSDLSQLTSLERFVSKYTRPHITPADKGCLQQLRNSKALQSIICDCVEGVGQFVFEIDLPCLQLVYIRFAKSSKRNIVRINLQNNDFPRLEILDVQNGQLQIDGHDEALKRKVKESYLNNIQKQYEQYGYCSYKQPHSAEEPLSQPHSLKQTDSGEQSGLIARAAVSPTNHDLCNRNYTAIPTYHQIQKESQRTFIINADNVEDIPTEVQFKHCASRATSVQQ